MSTFAWEWRNGQRVVTATDDLCIDCGQARNGNADRHCTARSTTNDRQHHRWKGELLPTAERVIEQEEERWRTDPPWGEQQPQIDWLETRYDDDTRAESAYFGAYDDE